MALKGANLLVRCLVVAGQLLLSPAMARTTHTSFHQAAYKTTLSNIKHIHPPSSQTSSAGYSLGQGPYYVVKNGSDTPILQSPNFNPYYLYTAASHTKLVTALFVLHTLKVNRELNTSDNWALLRAALIHSNNTAAERIARRAAPVPNDEVARQLIEKEAAALGVGEEFKIANASGLPDQNPRKREDSFASAHAVSVVAFALVKNYLPQLKDIYENITQADHPTNNLFWPVISRGDPADSDVFMFCKTRSDREQSRSTEVVLVTPKGTYSIFHIHTLSDPHNPIATTAALVLEVIAKEKLALPRPLTNRLLNIASGKIESHDVGPNIMPPHILLAHNTPNNKAHHHNMIMPHNISSNKSHHHMNARRIAAVNTGHHFS